MNAHKQIVKMGERGQFQITMPEMNPEDVALVQSTWEDMINDILQPSRHIFRWLDSGLIIDAEGRAVYPEIPTAELIDAVHYPMPFEKLWLETAVPTVGSNAVEHFCWLVERKEKGFLARSLVMRDGYIVDDGVFVGFDRDLLDDDGVPNFSYGAPTSFHERLDVNECRHRQQLLLRFFRLLCLQKLDIEPQIPDERVNAARVKRGRTPLPVQNVVRIKQHRAPQASVGGSTDREPPRPHHRRSHVRHLRDGRKINVRDTIVMRGNEVPLPPLYVA